MNKKFLIFGALAFFAVALVTALVVPYLSNTIIGDLTIDSPVTILIDGGETYSLSLFAGQSVTAETVTTVHVDGLTGHIAENKISNFDGEGLSVEFRVDEYLGVFQLPLCIVGDDAYFYIGDPTEVLNEGSFTSDTTFITELGLAPGVYDVESTVILYSEAECPSVPAPVFVAD